MKNRLVVLTRYRHWSGEYSTVGTIESGLYQGYSVENPWLQNCPWHSCIPEGHYVMKLGWYNKGGYAAYELLDVPGRTLIKIHIANKASEVDGCVGLGGGVTSVFHDNVEELRVSNSKTSLSNFMQELNNDPIVDLVINWKD